MMSFVIMSRTVGVFLVEREPSCRSSLQANETIEELFKEHNGVSEAKPPNGAQYLQGFTWWARPKDDSQWGCSRK